MKKFVVVLLALLMALSSVSALAAASVTWVGGAEKFVFLPGSEYSDSDLFENFKGVLPGDVIQQKITVQNDTKKKVRIYMRAEPVTKADEDFLSQLHLTVQAANKTIFDAPADQQDGLTKNTLLGTFKKNGKTELTVTLTVPIELGNEYMNRQGTVPWTFLVEEVTDDGTPETGDWFQIGAWAAAAVVLAGLIIVLIVRRRKEEA